MENYAVDLIYGRRQHYLWTLLPVIFVSLKFFGTENNPAQEDHSGVNVNFAVDIN